MPYIKEVDRLALIVPQQLGSLLPGELNYLITGQCMEYWRTSEKNYRVINDILGALEGAKLEFYRRVAVPYEERKRAENGDVYE